MPSNNQSVKGAILFFDGVCGFCHRTVMFLHHRDSKGRLFFAPLQGETAKGLLSEKERQELGTVVFWDNGKSYLYSAALVRALFVISFPWPIVGGIIMLVPWFIRDSVYRFIAARRHRFFGGESCVITIKEKDVFLP